MTIRHLRVFLAVYQAGSITRAAETLYMSQPAVSRAIQEMEKHYGVRLFERLNHRLYETESGRRMYAYALHLVDGFDRMEQSVRNGDEIGVIRLGASVTLGSSLMPGLVRRFQAMHPGLEVQVRIANCARLEEALLSNGLDMALLEGSVADGQLDCQAFSQDALLPVFSPAHPLAARETLTLREIAAAPLLMREVGSVGRSLVEHVFDGQGLTLRPAWESVSTQAILRAVEEGLGVSILPEQMVAKELRAGLIVTRPVTDASFARRHYIAWHRQKYLTAACLDFRALCMEKS